LEPQSKESLNLYIKGASPGNNVTGKCVVPEFGRGKIPVSPEISMSGPISVGAVVVMERNVSSG
jgi:hypothetical protein